MSNLPINRVGLIVAILLLAGSLQAQQYDSVLAKYKGHDAVVTNYTRHLVISSEGGQLVANSYYTKEKLFISDLARGVHNTDYLLHGDFNKLTNLDAVMSLPVKDGYRKVPCYNFADVAPDRDNVFYEDARYAVVSYSGLLQNSLTKTTYAIEHTDLNMLQPFIFQENIPVVSSVFEVTVPKYVKMGFVLRGIDTTRVKRTTEENSHTITYRFTATDLPAYKEYDNVPSPMYYLTQVIPYIISYKLSESAKKVEMLSNADNLYKYLYKYVRNINMKEDTMLDRTVADITKGDATQRQKAAHIYQWVQKNMHYIAFEKGLEGFVPREASVILRRKYGDCKDMASLLVTMCHKAGLDAYYTWIGTREKPYTIEETPLPLVNNHMICALRLGDEWIFMDGTHPYIPFGQNPDGIQGKEAMIAIGSKDYKIVTIPVAKAENNVVVDSTLMSFSESRLTGTVTQHYKGYGAWELGTMMMYLKGDDRDKAIRNLTIRGSDKYRQDSNVIYTGKTPDKNATIEAAFTVEDYVHNAGKQYFVNMNVKRTFEDRHIDAAHRDVPVYFDYKHQAKEVVVLDIPKGYKVAHLPPAAQGAVDGLWSYKISYKADKNSVTLVKEYELAAVSASPKLFADNNKMVDDLKKIYKESVVLTAN